MMHQYDALLRQLMSASTDHKVDRTQVGCTSLFGDQLHFNMTDGFPAVTSKKLHWQSVVKELLWFLRGETNTKTLGCKIWDQWARENGDCGPIYGAQWRSWEGVDQVLSEITGKTRVSTTDQLSDLIRNLKTNPGSRRHVVSAWNVSDLPEMGLAPCHCMFQFHVVHQNDQPKYLDQKLTQRSADVFLGVPFNIASYALLLHCVAKIVGLVPRNFIHSFGDVHLYDNHRAAVHKYLDYGDRHYHHPPTLKLPEFTTLEELEKCSADDFVLENYNHGPAIKAPVAV